MLFKRFLSDKIEKYIKDGKSILLLGPRQTGKSTIVENILNKSRYKNLVFKLQLFETYEKIAKNPSQIAHIVESKLEEENKINLFIDEVQKIPALLDDCQYLIDKHKNKLSVILTGSSARKLRARGVNLLPGRVFLQNLHGLILPEIMKSEVQRIVPIRVNNSKGLEKVSLNELLIFGTLPGVLIEKEKYKKELLQSYVSIYLKEEIKAEALTRNLGGFSNFLELAAFESGSIPNLSKLSQETGIPMMTVKNYFQLLEDTLVTFTIPAFKKKSRKQILSTPKYLFFDLGVRNVASDMVLDTKILKTEIGGKLFEQFICLELIKRIKYNYPTWKYYFWRTNNGLEVDFIIQTDEEIIPIEIKFTDVPQDSHIKHLKIFMEEYKQYNVKRGFLVGMFSSAMKLTKNIYAIPWDEI